MRRAEGSVAAPRHQRLCNDAGVRCPRGTVEHDDARNGRRTRATTAGLDGSPPRVRILDAVVHKPEQLWRIRHSVSESVQALGRMAAFDISVPRSAFAAFRGRAQDLVLMTVTDAQLCDFGHLGDGGVHLNVVRGSGLSGTLQRGARNRSLQPELLGPLYGAPDAGALRDPPIDARPWRAAWQCQVELIARSAASTGTWSIRGWEPALAVTSSEELALERQMRGCLAPVP